MFFKIIKLLFLFLGISLSTIAYCQSDFYDINQIREVKIIFPQSNWDHILDSLFSNFGEDAKLEGSVMIDGQRFDHVGIRYKGYSSWDADQVKNPFNIELDYKIPHQNYQGYTRLKLSNVVRDPSFIREALSYEILRKYMPASQANFANVYVNDQLIGLYTNVESVDEIFADKYFGSSGNCFFKGAPEHIEYPYGENSNLAYSHGTDSLSYTPYYKLVSDYGWSDLLHLIYVLNNDTSHISQVLNIDRALWMHAFDYTLVNLDSYIGYSQNYYMYKDDNGVFNSIIWDLNMSFGSFRNSDATTLNLTIPKVKQLNPLQILTANTYSPRPLIKNLLSNSTYRNMFIAHMRTILNENFKNNEYYLRGQQIQAIISSAVQQDPNKFYSYSNFLKNLDTIVGPASSQFPGIKDLMVDRIAYLDSFPGFQGYPSISTINHFPSNPEQGQETWITAKVQGATKVILGYRNNSRGIFIKTEMFDDGNHNDSLAGDHIYGVTVFPAGVKFQYFIYSENDSAGIFSPERAEYEFYSIQTRLKKGSISINEIAANQIEFINNTNENIDLTGFYLSDNKNNLQLWGFPDTIIIGKKYLIVQTNESPTINLHTNFLLDHTGGNLILSDSFGKIIDSVTFDRFESGKSIGRYPNAVGNFIYMPPTFSYCNNIGPLEGKDILIFPNPTKGNITIEFNNESRPYSVDVFSTTGKPMLHYDFEATNSDIKVINKEVDLSQIGTGVFLIKISDENQIITKRIIII